MSTNERVEVKLKGQVVEVIDVTTFESVDEADLSNKTREKYRPSIASKRRLRQLAFELCTPDRDSALHAQLMSKMGDFDALMEFLDSLADRVKAEILANPNYADNDEEDVA